MRQPIAIGLLLLFALPSLACLIWGSAMLKVLIIIIWTFYLFISEKFPMDITAIILMTVLILTGLVTPAEGVSGLSNPATITVLCMFVLSAGIQKTGIIQKAGNYILAYIGYSPTLRILTLCIVVGPLSGFINNTATVAIFIPMILSIANKSKTPASKLLIPLSYIAMMGGTLTLLGTSTNILANTILEDSGQTGFSIFEFMPIGLIVLAIGTIYFLTIGQFLLPIRKIEKTEPGLVEHKFLTELLIAKNSHLIGLTLKSTKFCHKYDIQALKIIRGKQSIIKELPDTILEENDIIMIFAEEQRILELDKLPYEKLLLNFDYSRRRMRTPNARFVKVLVKTPRLFYKRSLDKIDFYHRYSASVVGLNRPEGIPSNQRISEIQLHSGEIFLLKVSPSNLSMLVNNEDFMLLDEIEQEFHPKQTYTAISIIVLVFALATLKILPIMVAALCGMILLFLTRNLEADEIYRAISWNVIFLLAGVIPLGIAMQKSGTSDWIANAIMGSADIFPSLVILWLVYLFTTLLTEIISNNSAIVVLVPIAISITDKLFLDPKILVLTIMFAASTSFLTPIGYQTNTMVYGVGNYKFSDFTRVGAPLNLLLLIITPLLIYWYYS